MNNSSWLLAQLQQQRATLGDTPATKDDFCLLPGAIKTVKGFHYPLVILWNETPGRLIPMRLWVLHTYKTPKSTVLLNSSAEVTISSLGNMTLKIIEKKNQFLFLCFIIIMQKALHGWCISRVKWSNPFIWKVDLNQPWCMHMHWVDACWHFYKLENTWLTSVHNFK